MDRVQFFENLMVLAAADGAFTDDEMAMLVVRAEQWNITNQQVENAIRKSTAGDAALAIPPDPVQRRQLLGDLIRMMAVDGQLHETEKRLCATAAAVMNFTAEDVEKIIDALQEDG